MDFKVGLLLLVVATEGFILNGARSNRIEVNSVEVEAFSKDNTSEVFNGVYSECFLYLSYSCLQKKTLLYLEELNKLKEVSVIGDYVKFVKLNGTNEDRAIQGPNETTNEELSVLIDRSVDRFFNNHILKFNALGKDVTVPQSVEEFVGRKRKGGGGGGGHGGGHGGGGDDGGKKKMMMMAMMCMKMKLMMMVPAMMGMMGMMSFKGMMFSMMSFMISKMMLLMKILEKKGGGGGGGAGDGGWAAGGGGGGAWMPAGGDGGGGGGGYDANGQWQSRSIIEDKATELELGSTKPIISYVKPAVRYNGKFFDEINVNGGKGEPKSRKKRGIVDILHNAYWYWINRVLGYNYYKKIYQNYPKYKLVNGIKYVYFPLRQTKTKTPKELNYNLNVEQTKANDDVKIENGIKIEHEASFKPFKPIVAMEEFNRGEIVEGPIESRMNKQKLVEWKDTVNEALDHNPWQ